MAKKDTVFICSECTYQSLKWLGMCPECRSWNTLQETAVAAKSSNSSAMRASAVAKQIMTIDEIQTQFAARLVSNTDEWDRVIGGGIMPSSLIVLTGDPGIGKSTLLVQIAAQISAQAKVIYFSTEESLGQIKQRVLRIALPDNNILFSDEYLFSNVESIIAREQPGLAIIDSIQNCLLDDDQTHSPGSIAQLKEITFRLMRLAKQGNTAVIVTGHITKDGTMAGPKVLEHMVDAVFYLQGEETFGNRVLTATKNRFGSSGEVGFFQMQQNGLEPVSDINKKILQESKLSPGSCFTMLSHGSRPVIIELQALCVRSKFGQPQRIITGIDYKRVILIAAILEKNLKISFSTHDIFFKVSGGVYINEYNNDLAIALALMSSYFGQPLPDCCLALGEISLTGKIKGSSKQLSLAAQLINIGVHLLISGPQEKKNLSPNIVTVESVFNLLQFFPNMQTAKVEV